MKTTETNLQKRTIKKHIKMKTKRINHKMFLDFLQKEISKKYKIKKYKKINNGFYFFYGFDGFEVGELEFISENKKYFFTIYLRGAHNIEFDFLHQKVIDYINKLELGKKIIIDTETKITII